MKQHPNITLLSEEKVFGASSYTNHSWSCKCGQHGMWHSDRQTALRSSVEHIYPTTRMGIERPCKALENA